jgi:hypothetical protein
MKKSAPNVNEAICTMNELPPLTSDIHSIRAIEKKNNLFCFAVAELKITITVSIPNMAYIIPDEPTVGVASIAAKETTVEIV